MIPVIQLILVFILKASLLAVTLIQCTGKRNDKSEKRNTSAKATTNKSSLEQVDDSPTRLVEFSDDSDKKKSCADTALDKTDDNINSRSQSEFTPASETNFGNTQTDDTVSGHKMSMGTPTAESLLGNKTREVTITQDSKTLSSTQSSFSKTVTERSDVTNPSLSIEPQELGFSKDGDSKKLSLKNDSDHRIALKVKCTNNTIYRIEPVYAMLEPQQECELEVFRLKGESKADRLILLYSKTEESETDPMEHFQTPGIETHRKTVLLNA